MAEPYRHPVETVLARCAELCRRIEARGREALAAPAGVGLAEALAWEERLRARLAALEAHQREKDSEGDEIGGLAHAAPPDAAPGSPPNLWPFVVLGAAAGFVVVAAVAAVAALGR